MKKKDKRKPNKVKLSKAETVGLAACSAILGTLCAGTGWMLGGVGGAVIGGYIGGALPFAFDDQNK